MVQTVEEEERTMRDDCSLKRKYKVSTIIRVQKLLGEGLCTDGGHHKQWYLEQIAKELGLEVPGTDVREEGIAP